jgi:hypothetical protein
MDNRCFFIRICDPTRFDINRADRSFIKYKGRLSIIPHTFLRQALAQVIPQIGVFSFEGDIRFKLAQRVVDMQGPRRNFKTCAPGRHQAASLDDIDYLSQIKRGHQDQAR